MRVLFVCTANKLRSPTAETLFSGRRGLEVSSAGLDGSAPRVVDASMVEQADLVFVMERRHPRQAEEAVSGLRRQACRAWHPGRVRARPAGTGRAAPGKGHAIS